MRQPKFNFWVVMEMGGDGKFNPATDEDGLVLAYRLKRDAQANANARDCEGAYVQLYGPIS